MALVIGTNCGFVTTAPTSDPLGVSTIDVASFSSSTIDTSPSSINRITEIGFYVDLNNSNTTNDWQVGVYNDEGNDEPEILIEASNGSISGSSSGWEKITGLNIPITANTNYWLAIQLDSGGNITTNINTSTGNGYGRSAGGATELPSDWGTSVFKSTNSIGAIYALTDNGFVPPEGTNQQINIGDVWKEISAKQINISDVWKEIIGEQINIGDTWKTIF